MHSHVYLNYGWLDSRLSRDDSSSGGVHGLDAVVDGSHHLRFCGVKWCAPSIRQIMFRRARFIATNPGFWVRDEPRLLGSPEDLDEFFQDKVKFGDNSTTVVKGKGKVTIRAKDNSIQTIANVLYVLDLKSNLLSLGQLQEKGYEIPIKDGVCQVHDSKFRLIAKNSEGQTQQTRGLTLADLKVSRQTVEESLPADIELSTGGSLPTTPKLEFGTSSQPQRKKRRPAWLEDYEEVLDIFQMKNCNSVITPVDKGVKLMKDPGGRFMDSKLYKQIVGSLMYLTATRPDIMYGVNFGLFYKKGDQTDLACFTASVYAGKLDDRKTTFGYVLMLGSGAVSWSSKKQPIVTFSTTEAKYVAATFCACQAIWLRRVLEELALNQHAATSIYCDNSSTIKLSRNPVLHGTSKHIHVRYHFLCNLVEDGTIELTYCRTEDEVADIFTKPLKVATFSN
ncbi:hypothetical protein SLEP1_g18413 [Rubroshorea leprosula]|uniref:Retrovirus-related Pol polyprotein from transposon TNT 1-94-like beta-barrel domain-containing protein n=1 Tax=Rubroshorea leprosula TaxID=152421 RepID=A0AAV5J2X8_9ROSI|nr:hypothetical protein SLEP1_g18413 [Rubroshorea leprosula]